MKKIVILALAIAFASPIFAERQEIRDWSNWSKENSGISRNRDFSTLSGGNPAGLVVALAGTERQDFRERADNWLQGNSGGLRDGGGLPGLDDDEPTNPPFPIGGGMAVLLALGGGYILRKKTKK